MESLKIKIVSLLRWSEKYTKTDMVYLTKNTFWLNLNNILTSIFAFILSIIFARFVSKEIYGNYQFLISFASIIGTLTLTGMNAGVIQAVARGFEGVFKRSVKIQIKFAIIPFIVANLASAYYLLNSNIEISVSLIFISIFLPLSNALNTWTAFLSGKKEFKNIFLYSQFSNLIYYGSMIACVFFLPKTIFLIFINFATIAIANFFIHLYTIKKYSPNTESEEESLVYGKKLSLSSIMPLIALHVDNILIFHLLGAQSLAIYAFASNIPDKFMSLIRPISTIAMPRIAEQANGWEKSLFIQKVLRFSILALLMSLIYIFISPIVYKTLFPAYIESIKFSQVYIFATAFSAISSFCLASIFASRSKGIFAYNIWNPIVNILAITIGAYIFGIWGTILGKIIGSIFSSLYSFSLEQKN